MTQKKLIVSVYVFVCCVVTAMGQSLKYYNADDFPLIGKMSDDTGRALCPFTSFL